MNPATRLAKVRVASIAVNSFVFSKPVLVADPVSLYAGVISLGRPSITVDVTAFARLSL